MEIHEFAQRVLFSDSLAEKLAPAADLTDTAPGKALTTPGAPGRPDVLRMRRSEGRAPFPPIHRLVDEEQRGRLLHFFANHELLATELMALVLLKFPEAPTAFRRGIVRTLQEEQTHTQWYLTRMEQCGVQFGELPLNRFFWDAVAPMETPLDYVTRLSLTFEQANLDYAKHYSAILREAGDPQTAAILDQIYRDEIAHVGYGLRWFRRWKADGHSDWDAYRSQLHFPLSPSRGKGNAPFNAEGRLQAGLDQEFVREMELFEQSKGRTPNVFWFNPSAEAIIAAQRAGIRFHPRREIAALTRDLEILPAFLSRRDDVLLMMAPPSMEERSRLRNAGLVLPEFEALDKDGAIAAGSQLRDRKLNGLRPWAWAPDSEALFAPLVQNLPTSPMSQMSPTGQTMIFSKEWAVTMRHQLSDPSIDGRICKSLEEIDIAIAALRTETPSAIALKAPFGASGQKNRRLLADEPFTEAVRRWAQRILTEQQALVVEPWLERVWDFSVQFEMDDTRLEKVALIHLFNDQRGQFRACECGPRFGQGLPNEVARFLMGNGKAGAESPLRLYDGIIRELLCAGLKSAGYRGPVGVDAFVYRAPGGALGLQPIVEINPRYTMGRLTWELMRQVSPGHPIRFELVNTAIARAAESDSLHGYAINLGQTAPAKFDGKGRLCGGSLVLNDASKASQCLAVLSVR